MSALLPALTIFCACGGDEDDGTLGPPASPETFADHFMSAPYGSSDCDARLDGLVGTRELLLFRAGNQELRPFTRGLQRYYQRHGLQFTTLHPVQRAPLEYALNTDLADLERQARRAFPDVDFSDQAPPPSLAKQQEIIAFIVNAMFEPVTKFARERGTMNTKRTHVVFLKQLIRPGGDAPDFEGHLAGLAISPSLLATLRQLGTEEAEVWKDVDLPADFAPMMFLDISLLSQLQGQANIAVDLIMAHEFGHSGGLVHREEIDNLMKAQLSAADVNCRQGLDDDQLATMRGSMGLASALAAEIALPRTHELHGDTRLTAAEQPQLFAHAWAALHGDRNGLRALLKRALAGH